MPHRVPECRQRAPLLRRNPVPPGRLRLICVADPRQGWDPLLSQLFGLVPAHVPGGGGPQSGSRWSAHSAARTNDLEADEDPPQTWPAGGEAKTLRFKSSAASWERRTCCGRQRRTCRRPALSGSTDEVRRHDDGWGARRAGCRRGAVAQSLREVHPTTRRWRQANCGSWPQASADLWAGHVRNASQAATSCGRISGSARAASPSSRSV